MKTLPPTCEKYLENFTAALDQLVTSVKKEEPPSKIIRAFELTHEIALNTIGEYFRQEGREPFSGSRDATVEAFHENLIDDGEGWMDMIIYRIKYNPIYPEKFEDTFVSHIKKRFISLLENFEGKMQARIDP